MLVVGLNGSPNKDGNIMFLLNSLKKEIENLGGGFEIIDVQDAVVDCKQPFCIGCSVPCNSSCFKDTKLEKAYNLITKADAVVVGSPVYFGTISAQLKTFFDKTRAMRNTKNWIGKIGAGITCGASKYGGQEMTISTINNILSVHGFTLINDAHKDYKAGHFGVCAQNPAKEDAQALESLKILANRIVDSGLN